MTLQRSEFEGRRVAVLGIARTGLAAAPILRDLRARVLLSDSQPASALGERLAQARESGVDIVTGASPAEALEGAELVVPSPGIRPDSPVLQLAIERGIPVLSEIEVAYRICEAPILAVTGTNGKTTTAVWLAEMMRAAGRKTWLAGNIAADAIKMPLISAAAEAAPGDTVVAEISSFQLMWVERFRPRVGILTNITPDHMNWHASFAEYAGSKARLFAAQEQNDVAIINRLNAPARAIGERIRSRLFWFDHGNCMGDDSACVRKGRITVRWGGMEHDLGPQEALRLPGMHNIENALAAAGAAISLGVDPESLRQTLAAFTGVVHRMEHVADIGGVRYINNSMCTNVDAAVRSLEAMDRPTVVIAGGQSKNTNFEPLGSGLALNARHAVLIGEAAPAIGAAARAAGFTAISLASSMEEAVRIASSLARPGEAVILSPACASFGMFSDFEARGEAFRQSVRNLLKG